MDLYCFRRKRETYHGSSKLQNPLLDFSKNFQSRQSCQYKYQQALVDVYARFVISVPGEVSRYYRNHKTYVRVTDLVANRMKASNHHVARIVGSTVQGVAPGKTDVQVGWQLLPFFINWMKCKSSIYFSLLLLGGGPAVV